MYFVWHIKHFINFIHLILLQCAVCWSGIIFTLLIRRFTFTQSQTGIGVRTGLRAPDVAVTSCLLMVVAQMDLSHPRVTLKVRLGFPHYRHLFVSALAKPHWMRGVVFVLAKGYPSFQITEQVSFLWKPKVLQTEKEAWITSCNNCMCKIIQKLSSRYICTVTLLYAKERKRSNTVAQEGTVQVLSTKCSHDYGPEESDGDRIFWLTADLW